MQKYYGFFRNKVVFRIFKIVGKKIILIRRGLIDLLILEIGLRNLYFWFDKFEEHNRIFRCVIKTLVLARNTYVVIGMKGMLMMS